MEIIEGQDFMEVLNIITAKKVVELDENEKAFLRARQYYLTPGQLDKFSDVLVIPSVEEPKPRIVKKTKAKLE